MPRKTALPVVLLIAAGGIAVVVWNSGPAPDPDFTPRARVPEPRPIPPSPPEETRAPWAMSDGLSPLADPDTVFPTNRTDPRLAADFDAQLRRLRLSPVFSDREVDGYAVDPYLVYAIHVGTPLAARADLRTFTVLLFPGQKSFMAYRRKIESPTTPDDHGTYWRRDRECHVVWDRDEDPHEGTLHANPQSVLKAVCVHQFLHAYRRLMQELRNGREMLWSADSTRTDSLWIEEGLAGLLGEASVDLPPKIAIETWKLLRSWGHRDWTPKELLEVSSWGELLRRSERESLLGTANCPLLFQAQATCLAWFLWNFEGGKYRPRYLRAIGSDLLGDSGEEVVASILFESAADRVRMEREWERATENLLAR